MDLNCSECYEIEYAACYAYLFLDVSLTPNTDYFVWVKDKFNNYHISSVTSNANGDIHVPIGDFPDGMFISGTGYFTLYISTNDSVNTKEEFTISYTTYDCIVFNFLTQTIL